ncbi:hypothetical protein [Epilithonimonas zeae]|uniref:hypothetical protein n=1 Tax=Epilithonimonas zeae TaxID=1416779 RepID=UPI00200C54A8|nr:hypothetical protein [Epilithonimonas zeae]UQB69165.1 hypothetical protein KI430_01615 [Epilithonimonas zeae]
MKKFISTILTLAIVTIAHSCRPQDDILTANNEISQNSIFKKSSDSVQTDSTSIPQKPVVGDPPPKNGHQW